MRFTMLLLAFTLSACAAQKPAAPSSPRTMIPDLYANGRSIFMTGVDLAGHRITASPAPMRPACADCHRANGAGGMKFGGGVVSADLRHDALTREQDHPYTVPLLMRAISSGVDNDGDRLSSVMPRWHMSKADLHDVAVYVYDRLK